MSIMRCSKCETMVDTDVDGFFFTGNLCDNCYVALLDAINSPKPRFSLIRLLKSIAAGIYATAKNWR